MPEKAKIFKKFCGDLIKTGLLIGKK